MICVYRNSRDSTAYMLEQVQRKLLSYAGHILKKWLFFPWLYYCPPNYYMENWALALENYLLPQISFNVPALFSRHLVHFSLPTSLEYSVPTFSLM